MLPGQGAGHGKNQGAHLLFCGVKGGFLHRIIGIVDEHGMEVPVPGMADDHHLQIMGPGDLLKPPDTVGNSGHRHGKVQGLDKLGVFDQSGGAALPRLPQDIPFGLGPGEHKGRTLTECRFKPGLLLGPERRAVVELHQQCRPRARGQVNAVHPRDRL